MSNPLDPSEPTAGPSSFIASDQIMHELQSNLKILSGKLGLLFEQLEKANPPADVPSMSNIDTSCPTMFGSDSKPTQNLPDNKAISTRTEKSPDLAQNLPDIVKSENIPNASNVANFFLEMPVLNRESGECADEKLRTCPKCNQSKRVFTSGLCQSCYSRNYYQNRGTAICEKCGDEKRILARNRCTKCYLEDSRRIETCISCGRVQKIMARSKCQNCYIKEQRIGHNKTSKSTVRACRTWPHENRKFGVRRKRRSKQSGPCSNCKQNIKLCARNLCQTCYARWNRLRKLSKGTEWVENFGRCKGCLEECIQIVKWQRCRLCYEKYYSDQKLGLVDPSRADQICTQCSQLCKIYAREKCLECYQVWYKEHKQPAKKKLLSRRTRKCHDCKNELLTHRWGRCRECYHKLKNERKANIHEGSESASIPPQSSTSKIKVEEPQNEPEIEIICVKPPRTSLPNNLAPLSNTTTPKIPSSGPRNSTPTVGPSSSSSSAVGTPANATNNPQIIVPRNAMSNTAVRTSNPNIVSRNAARATKTTISPNKRKAPISDEEIIYLSSASEGECYE